MQSRQDKPTIRLNGYKHGDFSLVPPIPIDMSLDLSAACNHSCLFCPNRKQLKRTSVMPHAFAERILLEAFQLGVRQVGLYGQGEPFLVKDFDRYVASAKLIGYSYVYATTNGSLLSIALLERNLQAGLDSLKFSINACSREEYKLVHGRDDFDKVLKNIGAAIELKKRYKYKLFISCVQSRLAPDAGKKLKERFGNVVDEVAFYECSSFNGLALENGGILTDEMRPVTPPCHWPFSRLSISPEGYLSACCGDYQNYLAISDLNKVSIKEGWESEKFIELRKRHLEGRLQGTLCHSCATNENLPYMPLDSSLASLVDIDSYYSKASLESEIERRKQKQK